MISILHAITKQINNCRNSRHINKELYLIHSMRNRIQHFHSNSQKLIKYDTERYSTSNNRKEPTKPGFHYETKTQLNNLLHTNYTTNSQARQMGHVPRLLGPRRRLHLQIQHVPFKKPPLYYLLIGRNGLVFAAPHYAEVTSHLLERQLMTISPSTSPKTINT